MEELGKNEESGQLNQETMSDSEPGSDAGPQEAQPIGEVDMADAPPQENSEERPEQDVQKAGDTMETLMDMYEESFKRFAEGEVVSGRIISVDKDHVLVDIGYKSEGQIRIHEFKDEKGNISAEIGDKVEVMVEWWDDEEERVVLSKEGPKCQGLGRDQKILR
jgi:small subunit ribosomal protein S1